MGLIVIKNFSFLQNFKPPLPYFIRKLNNTNFINYSGPLELCVGGGNLNKNPFKPWAKQYTDCFVSPLISSNY